MPKPVVHIDHWHIQPLRDHHRLEGRCYDHPRHADGTWILTGPIIGITTEGHIETKNSLYLIGRVDANYAHVIVRQVEIMVESLAEDAMVNTVMDALRKLMEREGVKLHA